MTKNEKNIKISEAIVAYFKTHGPTKRDTLFKIGINAAQLTKEEKANKSSDSLYNKVRALTGSIISDLIKAGSINLPDDAEAAKQAVAPKTKKSAEPTDEYGRRKKIIFEYLSAKYLTDAEKKDKTKINILKSIINDKNKKQKISEGTIDKAREAVEQDFISAAKINPEVTKTKTTVTFPNTTIGNFLRNEYDYYLKCTENKISQADYERRFDDAIFEAIKINGGEFFEIFCLDVLKAVYGEADIVKGSAKNTGGADDHGIDCEMTLIDKLGMTDKLVVQTKLGERGEKAVREFMGSMAFASAQKGVFITALEIDARTHTLFKNTKNLMLLGRKELLPLIKKHSVGIVKDKKGILMLDKNYYIIRLD